ncbi:hypothetical protein FA09DRAFT_360692 [Tilletiopsis washingtonensis]|uniref:Uncharacterized protein n=1 Tax=Tilletiopsis washingtonensis TaxID=58919 RepID=A0A316Z9B6_9BASI|nr:hypothetical protein FA09DRAFT_360692 [Tilletiopsis washingtonensis]PWN97876.1 hypothetical protein FA09DRAFT_360692 [Tilletiopsis washingtonensis]
MATSRARLRAALVCTAWLPLAAGRDLRSEVRKLPGSPCGASRRSRGACRCGGMRGCPQPLQLQRCECSRSGVRVLKIRRYLDGAVGLRLHRQAAEVQLDLKEPQTTTSSSPLADFEVAACWCAGRGSSRQASRGGAAAAKPALSRPIAQRGAASHLAHRGPRPRPLHASQQQRRSSVRSSCRKRAAGSAATAAACCSSCEQGHACRGPMLQRARPIGPGRCFHAHITALLCSAHAMLMLLLQQHLGKCSTPIRASDGASQQKRRCAQCRTTHVWRIRSGRSSGRPQSAAPPSQPQARLLSLWRTRLHHAPLLDAPLLRRGLPCRGCGSRDAGCAEQHALRRAWHCICRTYAGTAAGRTRHDDRRRAHIRRDAPHHDDSPRHARRNGHDRRRLGAGAEDGPQQGRRGRHRPRRCGAARGARPRRVLVPPSPPCASRAAHGTHRRGGARGRREEERAARAACIHGLARRPAACNGPCGSACRRRAGRVAVPALVGGRRVPDALAARACIQRSRHHAQLVRLGTGAAASRHLFHQRCCARSVAQHAAAARLSRAAAAGWLRLRGRRPRTCSRRSRRCPCRARLASSWQH